MINTLIFSDFPHRGKHFDGHPCDIGTSSIRNFIREGVKELVIDWWRCWWSVKVDSMVVTAEFSCEFFSVFTNRGGEVLRSRGVHDVNEVVTVVDGRLDKI